MYRKYASSSHISSSSSSSSSDSESDDEFYDNIKKAVTQIIINNQFIVSQILFNSEDSDDSDDSQDSQGESIPDPIVINRDIESYKSTMDFPPTRLDYHVDMFNLQSQSRFLSLYKGQDGRTALILESTVFHPQGGGQPSDTGFIEFSGLDFKFCVQDVRSKDGIVLHYGVFEGANPESGMDIEKGKEVHLTVDESRRKLNSRLHSAGHLLDMCMQKVGLGHLEPGKGYHFPDGPFVEYKGSVPQDELQVKQKELETEANELITKGGKVYSAILPYEEASVLCGGSLPDYIPKGSTPRIIKLGDNPGCPCGGTHVSDISDIISMKITQMRTKKGMTKVSYTIAS